MGQWGPIKIQHFILGLFCFFLEVRPAQKTYVRDGAVKRAECELTNVRSQEESLSVRELEET